MKNKQKKESAASLEIKKLCSWYGKIFDQLDYSSKSVGSDANIDDEPEWVINVLKELLQQASPTFPIRKFEGISPRTLGLYLGQQCSNFYAIGDMMIEPNAKQKKAASKMLKVFEENKHLRGVESALLVLNSFQNLAVELPDKIEEFEKRIHESFKAALEQPNYQEAVEFFQGFAKGISKAGISKSGIVGQTTATLIYQKLHVHRREVEKLANFPELRRFLVRQGVPEQVMGSVGRLRKMCERLGLHLANPGRPRNPK